MRCACLVLLVATACARPHAADPAPISSPASAPAPTPAPEPLVVAAPPPTESRVPAGSGCLSSGDAQIAARQTDARTRSQQAFDAELAKLGLTPIHLPIYIDETRAKGATVSTRIDGVSGEFVVGAYRLGCEAPKPWELARDARGDIVRVVRMPRTATTTTLVACGCQTVPHQCPPTCGMARSTQQLHGPLPPGARFAGSVEVHHDVHAALLTFATGRCPATVPAPVCRHAP